MRDLLLGRDLQVYLPMPASASKPRSRRPQEEALFAHYLFVRFDPMVTPRSSPNWTHSVTRLVSFGGEPAVVPDSVITCLQRQLDPADAVRPWWALTLKANDRLRITGGPLAGLEASFDRRLSSENRVRVFVEIMGRLRASEIALDWLEKVDQAASSSSGTHLA